MALHMIILNFYYLSFCPSLLCKFFPSSIHIRNNNLQTPIVTTLPTSYHSDGQSINCRDKRDCHVCALSSRGLCKVLSSQPYRMPSPPEMYEEFHSKSESALFTLRVVYVFP